MSLRYENNEPDTAQVDEAESAPSAASDLPVYTIILIAAIGVVFVAQLAAGVDASILAAGFVKPAFMHDHEYWRILTGATTHGSIMHVVMNCYAFYSFGRIFEMLSNRAHLAIVFLLSAIGGGILTLVFQPDGISVGASGGIVGLVSYLAVYSFKRRQFISYEFRKSLLINIGFILVFGLVLYNVVDNFGHIGGLITGAVYGLIQIPTSAYSDPRDASGSTQIAGFAALGIYLAGCAFSILAIMRVV
ncbi:MAG TPA: rhomboid family intramembrane serine protease [Pyrinomonadaceae bacterium]|jgi:membrane associated rhomboid family serine protease|nr:rhomboid family intramembrane serine protease [Pyrinomonadaceae bacterium]